MQTGGAIQTIQTMLTMLTMLTRLTMLTMLTLLTLLTLLTRLTLRTRPPQTMRCLRERASRLGQVVHRLSHNTSESGATDIH
jgi:hypothetical protein